jgi:hypothetical protein
VYSAILPALRKTKKGPRTPKDARTQYYLGELTEIPPDAALEDKGGVRVAA